MLTLAELVKLPKTNQSIKKIDLFIGSCVKGSNEYIKALCYKASVLHNVGKTNDALKLIYSYVPEFKLADFVIDLIFDIVGVVSRLPNARKVPPLIVALPSVSSAVAVP